MHIPDFHIKYPTFQVRYLCSSIATTALSTPLQYGIRFLQHPLPSKPSPFLTVGIPFHICVWGLLGLPSSLCPTFNRTLREVLSPSCATDDKEMKKNHPYPATHLFGLGVSAIFRRFLITRFITPSLSFPIGSLASPQPALQLSADGTLFLPLHTSSLLKMHGQVAIIDHLNTSF